MRRLNASDESTSPVKVHSHLKRSVSLSKVASVLFPKYEFGEKAYGIRRLLQHFVIIFVTVFVLCKMYDSVFPSVGVVFHYSSPFEIFNTMALLWPPAQLLLHVKNNIKYRIRYF